MTGGNFSYFCNTLKHLDGIETAFKSIIVHTWRDYAAIARIFNCIERFVLYLGASF
jgi:hypothetical protein